jgi:hypothetical protein
MAADADYTPLVIRLRKHLKITVVYAAKATSVAYRAACDSIIDEVSMLEILAGEEDHSQQAEETGTIEMVQDQPTSEKVKDIIDGYFAESEQGHKANVSTLGHLLRRRFPDLSNDWLGHTSLSQLLRRICSLKVEMVGTRTLASRQDVSAPEDTTPHV